MRQRNLYMWRGEDVQFIIALEGSGDISASEFRCDIRADRNESNAIPPLVTKTNGSGITITDGPNRILALVLSRDDTIDLVDEDDLVGWWEIAEIGAGSNAALAGGKLTIWNRSVRV